MQIARQSEAQDKYEYGCDLRRLYPWPGTCDPLYWGAALATVRPGEATTLDQHDESETFLIISGRGSMEIEEESEAVGPGDMVLIPKNKRHRIVNLDSGQPLVFISIFWDSPEARRGIIERLTADGVEP